MCRKKLPASGKAKGLTGKVTPGGCLRRLIIYILGVSLSGHLFFILVVQENHLEGFKKKNPAGCHKVLELGAPFHPPLTAAALIHRDTMSLKR